MLSTRSRARDRGLAPASSSSPRWIGCFARTPRGLGADIETRGEQENDGAGGGRWSPVAALTEEQSAEARPTRLPCVPGVLGFSGSSELGLAQERLFLSVLIAR